MLFTPTTLPGAFIIQPERHEDERGWFARTFSQDEFEAHGLNSCVAQCSVSYNKMAGTFRGMHYQTKPYEEAKVVRCTMGAIYDIVIDIRPASPTYCQWFATELNVTNGAMLYIPEGFAHGFLTLADNTEVYYQMSEFYHPEAAKGFQWNDPLFKLELPLLPRVISMRDASYPDYRP